MGMKVFVNGHEVRIFEGARIMDAIRAYSPRSSRQVEKGILIIFDKFGNLTEPDGPVNDGQLLTLKRNRSLQS